MDFVILNSVFIAYQWRFPKSWWNLKLSESVFEVLVSHFNFREESHIGSWNLGTTQLPWKPEVSACASVCFKVNVYFAKAISKTGSVVFQDLGVIQLNFKTGPQLWQHILRSFTWAWFLSIKFYSYFSLTDLNLNLWYIKLFNSRLT